MRLTSSLVASLIVTVVLILFYLVTLSSQILQTADFAVFDRQSRYLAKQLPVDDEIVVIAIDDHSLQQMNAVAGRWLWPRTVHGQVVEALQPFGLSAIAFDILFAEKDIYRPDADTYFNEVLANSTDVYFATLDQKIVAGGGGLLKELPKELGLKKTSTVNDNAKGRFILPQAINPEFWQVGSINFNADFDGIGRRYDVYRDISGWRIPSLPAKLISSLSLPLPDRQQVLLQWRGSANKSYWTISYVDVYKAAINDDKDFLQQLSGKIVLIGATASGLFDIRPTPLNNRLPGVYMLAAAIDNLKNKNFLTQVSGFNHAIAGVVVIFITCSVFMLVTGYARKVVYTLLLITVISLALMAISTELLRQQQLLFIGTILCFMLFSFMTFSFIYGYLEYRRRRQALTMFGRFLDPQVVYKLLEEDALSPQQLNRKQTLTVLFSDIRNFTQLSEECDAQAVVTLLNQYFNQQVAIIFNHKGTLDKFIGDCVMAFWGAPVQSEPKQNAVAAIATALAMEEQLLCFQQSLPTEQQNFDIGIGIHTGECIVGMIGADLRLDYTVIGDTVNLASRIEGLTKNHTRILVSEQTKILANHAFDFSYQGEHQVKGRQGKVKLYQPQRRQ